MAARFAWSGLVLEDNVSGKPLSNGKINFWVNGDTTDQDTFTTVSLGVANTNPLILDADGRVPEAWSADNDVYAVRILDENDNVILSTVQNLSFIASSTVSSANVIAALAANAAAVVINGSSMAGSAFAAFADNLDLTAAGSIDASAGAITLGTVSGATTFADVFVADGSGLVIGHTAKVAVDGVTSESEILGTVTADSSQSIQRYSADAPGPELFLFKSRGALGTVGSSVADNDELGAISFLGDDGSDSATKAARIFARIDGTPGTGDLPTELVFQTGDGGSLVTGLIISPTGNLTTTGTLASGALTVTTGTLTASGGGSLTGTWSDLGTVTTVVINGGIITGITDIVVADGGTGVSSLTNGGVLLGSGTGPITAMAVLTNGQMIVGDGTTDPVAESGATLRTSIGVGTGDSPTFTGLTLSGSMNIAGVIDNSAGAVILQHASVQKFTTTSNGIDVDATFTTDDSSVQVAGFRSDAGTQAGALVVRTGYSIGTVNNRFAELQALSNNDTNPTPLHLNPDGGVVTAGAGIDITGALSVTTGVNMADTDLNRPVIEDYGVKHHVETSSAGTLTVDMSIGNSTVYTFTENVTTVTISNPPDSGTYGEVNLKLIQHASAAKTIAWAAKFEFPGGTDHVMSTAVSSVDVVHLWTIDGGATYYCTFASGFA